MLLNYYLKNNLARKEFQTDKCQFNCPIKIVIKYVISQNSSRFSVLNKILAYETEIYNTYQIHVYEFSL